MSNEELIEAYLNSLMLLSKKTILLYSCILKMLATSFQKSFLELTTADLRTYIIKNKESKRWTKANTIAKHIVVLKSFFKFLISENLLKEEANPVRSIKAPQCHPNGETRAFNVEELRKLIKASESPMIELRTRLIFYLALSTGLRASELASIKKQNIDLEKGLIFIPKDDVKGQYREKCVSITDSRAKELLDAYRTKYPNNTEYLFLNRFGKQLSYQMIYLAMKNVIDVAYPYKDSWNKPCGPHMARHTFASRWIESGGDVNALRAVMGWNSFQQMDRYINVSPTFISNAAAKVGRKLLKV